MSVPHNRIMEESKGRLLCLEVTQPVYAESYTERYWPQIEARYKEFGEARLFFFYPDGDNFPGWQEEAAKIDLAHYTTRGHYISRIALVGAPLKVVQRYELLSALINGSVRSFNIDQRDEAMEWVNQD